VIDDHGTHVAGTIGAQSNGVGVAGVNWNVTMIPAKFLGRQGGSTLNAIKAVNYITDLKTRHGLNIVATNNSWGGSGMSIGLLDAINRAGNAGILFIAAAGNGGKDGNGDNNDATPSYPSNYQCTNGNTRGWDCVISVAAITNAGAKSSFSNYGVNMVDIGAPGSAIVSTLPTRQGDSSYGSYSGTSMATPHVTGAAALYASTHPGATALEIKNAILASAVPTASLAGRTVSGGRLNVSGF
jgi:subtilisin family serine protease